MTKKFVPVIEKNVPIPQNRAQKGFADTLRKMEVGDCAWFPTNAPALRASGRKAFGTGGYMVREESRDLEAGSRIWRLK